MNANAFSWRNDWVSRYESLWSLLHKFAFLNALNYSDIREILFSKPTSTDQLKYRNRADLRFFNVLDPEKLACLFRVDRDSIDDCVVTTYLKSDECHTLSAGNLRYCKRCLQTGFHSTFHQLLIFRQCPIHHENLTTNCTVCRSQIPYKLNTEAFKKPYCCSNCGVPLSETVTFASKKNHQPRSREPQSQADTLGSISDWLRRRIESKSFDCRFNFGSDSENFFFKGDQSKSQITHLINYWSDTFKTNVKLKEILSGQTAALNYHCVFDYKFNERRQEESAEPFSEKWNQDLAKIYKSIRRYLIKTHLHKHLSCIEEYGRKIRWYRGDSVCKGQICSEANAYLLWRMCVEEINYPKILFKPKIRLRKHRKRELIPSLVRWDPPSYSLPPPVLKRIFALECYWMFYECQILAKILNADYSYSFHTGYITRRLTPHWIALSPDHNEDHFELHWWVSKEVLERRFNHCFRKKEKAANCQ